MGRVGLVMVNIKIGGSVDIQKIHRLVQENEVLIGYPDGVQHPKTTIQNSDMARALHFGTRSIPARPFLYDAIVSVRSQLQEKMKKMHERNIERGGVQEPTGEFSLEGIGAFIVGAVQRLVRGGYYKGVMPNAPITIARKGSDTPLIDTGFLMQSTTFVTRKHPPKIRMRKVEISGEAGPK
jgi:hypothetical protein